MARPKRLFHSTNRWQLILRTEKSLPSCRAGAHTTFEFAGDNFAVRGNHQRQAANEADQIRPTVYKTPWDTKLAGPQEIIVRADVPNSFQTT
jgi:hypothetical protein